MPKSSKQSYKRHQAPDYPRNVIDPAEADLKPPYGTMCEGDRISESARIAIERAALIQKITDPPKVGSRDAKPEKTKHPKAPLLAEELARPVKPHHLAKVFAKSDKTTKPTKAKTKRSK
jgi:hypothetical protein